MSNTPGIDKLRELNRTLGTLLSDPNPGLATWRKTLSRTLLEMADYAGVGNVSAFADLLFACKQALERLEWHARRNDGMYGDDFRAVENCMSAIAKAEG